MPLYRILSMDGGGIRGIIPSIILDRISQEPALHDFLDRVDLFAGTSTGGILALALARGLSPEVISRLYIDKGGYIFDDTIWDNIKDLGKIVGADYNTNHLKEVLHEHLGETKLSELNRKVLITAFDLDNNASNASARRWKPKIFHNFEKDPGNDGNELAYKVAMFTSAAPTYFPSVDGYIDGGVFASNPSMCALAQVLDKRTKLDLQLSDILLLSLGTGLSLTYIKGDKLDWGLAQWARPLITLNIDGVNGIADYQCRQILDNKYFRIEPVFAEGVTVGMDEYKKIDSMIDLAHNFDITKVISWLKTSGWIPSTTHHRTPPAT